MIDLGLLVLRLGAAGMMMTHGFAKLMNFSEYSATFPDFFGIGSPLTLALAIFGEFVCPLLIILGVLTRLSSFATLFTMGVAAFVAHAGDPFEKREMALLYGLIFLVIFIVGPGKTALWKPAKPLLQ